VGNEEGGLAIGFGHGWIQFGLRGSGGFEAGGSCLNNYSLDATSRPRVSPAPVQAGTLLQNGVGKEEDVNQQRDTDKCWDQANEPR
jgi:hypothetical protein